MSDTVFVDFSQQTPIVAAWLNDVNKLTYGAGSAVRGAALIQFMASATGTVRTSQAKLQESISVQDYGAVGDGTTDDTTAFNSAHTAAAALNKAVFIPATAAGYKLASTVTVKTSMFGEGSLTVLTTSSATVDVLQCAVAQVTLRDFAITSSVTRTAGSYINFNGTANNNNYCRADRLLLSNWFNGITIGGGGSTGIHLNDVFMSTNVVSGTGVTLSTAANAVNIVFNDLLILGPTSGTQCVSGILIVNAGDVLLNNVSTVKTGTGLNIKPTAAKNIQACMVSNSYFDSGTGQGINVDPAATATVKLLKVMNTWCCSNGNGIVLNPSNTGTTTRVELVNVTASNNTGQGILAQAGGTVTNLQIIGGSASANTNGVYIGATTSGVVIHGHTSGAAGEFAGNSAFGINIEAAADNFVITGNKLAGNTSGAISDATTPAITRIIRDNITFVTEASGTGSILSGTTAIAITHGLSRTPAAKDIWVTFTANTTADPGNIWVDTITSTQFTVNCRTNPGVSNAPFSWGARIV